jgi:hypothetical protein
MRVPTGLATTAQTLQVNQTPLVAPTPTERMPRRPTTLHVTPQQTTRRRHVLSHRAILLQIGPTTREERLTTLALTQLIGRLPSIRAHSGRRLQRDKSRTRLGLSPSSSAVRLHNSTPPHSSNTAHLSRNAANLDRKASPRVAILTPNRDGLPLWAISAMGHSNLRMAHFYLPGFIRVIRLAAFPARATLALGCC